MNITKKLTAFAVLTTTLALTACGGTEQNTASSDNENTPHPEFSWAKVSVSSAFKPSGDIQDTTPTFSWKAATGAVKYQFGHEDVDSATRWQEYTITAEQAGCKTTSQCSYTPNNIEFAVGDQKAWWVRAKDYSSWQDWSNTHVFKIVTDTSAPTTDVKTISPKGKIPETNPVFTWTPGNGATAYQLGFENQDGSGWTSFNLNTSQASCQATQCSYEPANSNFTPGDTKAWWVRSKVNGTWGNWGADTNFTIDSGIPTNPVVERPFIIEVKSTSFTIPTKGTGYNYNVDCDSDGIPEVTGATKDYTCTYQQDSNHKITISGVFPQFVRLSNSRNLVDVLQWGTQKWRSMAYAFQGEYRSRGDALNITALDIPDLSNVKSMEGMFASNRYISLNMGDWDTGNVTDMSSMFSSASILASKGIENFDTSNVTNMSNMFYSHHLRADITQWDVSKVTNMSKMFSGGASKTMSFNQDISGWDVSKVTNMSKMFTWNTTFNQNINTWNVSNVEDMSHMFAYNRAFDQSIPDWDVSKVANMEYMFIRTNFNQNISNWDVSNVEKMNSMFAHNKLFNQNISSWDVGKVTKMNRMFYRTLFNQDIGSWNVSNIEDMGYMFRLNRIFNQDLSNWDVSKVQRHTGFAIGSILKKEYMPEFL